MAKYTYDLKAASVSVSASEVTFPDSKQKVDGVEFAADYNNSVLETKHGLLTVTGRDHEYDFTALTGGISHFAIGGKPDLLVLALCMLFTLIWARIAAKIANKATPKTLNRATGMVLVALGVVIFAFSLIN